MRRAALLTTTFVAVVVAASALAGCTTTPSPQAAPPTPTTIVTPTPTFPTELPEWAQGHQVWLIYPDGFECGGTEGCPNDYRAFFGEPGPVLPDGVEYYDPAKHDCMAVAPLGVDCFG